MRRKRVAAVLMAATVVALGSGCGGSDNGSGDQEVRIATLTGQIKELRAQNRSLARENSRLRRQLKRSGTTAGTPQPVPAPDPGEPLSYDAFQTPSGNIACDLGGSVARCDIAEKSWDPGPRPAGCPVDWGGGLQVGGSGRGEIVCAGDTVMNPDAPVLEYGRQTQIGDFLCASEEDGVSCVQTASNHGFEISKQSFRLF